MCTCNIACTCAVCTCNIACTCAVCACNIACTCAVCTCNIVCTCAVCTCNIVCTCAVCTCNIVCTCAVCTCNIACTCLYKQLHANVHSIPPCHSPPLHYRYDLHEWLFTLHNAMENFKKRMQRNQQRQQQQQQPQEGQQQEGQQQEGQQQEGQQQEGQQQEGQRPRANTAEKARKPSATAGHTPPYRRAPPPPKDAGSKSEATNVTPTTGDNNSPRRKPVRPAPTAPSGRRHSATTSGDARLSQEVPTADMVPQETPPPHYSASLPTDALQPSYEGEHWMSQEGYGTDQDMFGTMDSATHMVVDLNITQTDREEVSPEYMPHPPDMSYPSDMPHPSDVPHMPHPVHVRSASDSLVFQPSNSLPDLLDPGSSTSPEENGEGGKEGVAQAKHTPNSSHGHTRHLSLMGGSSKTKKRRASSFKHRSRSPPNLPPPPPPPEPLSAPEEVDGTKQKTLHISTNGLTPNTSTGSLGFSGVLDTITDIDQQLDHMLNSSQEQHSPPKTVASILFHHPKLGLSPAPTPGTPEGEGHFQEEEWLCDSPKGPPGDIGPAPVAISSVADHSALVNAKSKPKHRVMFKEEVEAIPYDPGEDIPSPPPGEEEEEVLTGVAAIKQKLFGSQEQQSTRYKKDGILSPKYVHPENMTFSDDYFSNAGGVGGHSNGGVIYRDSSPNVNNNNSEDDAPANHPTSTLTTDPQPASTLTTDPSTLTTDPSTLTTDPQPALTTDQPDPQPSLTNGQPDPQPTTLTNDPPPTNSPIPEDPPEPEQNMYERPWDQKSVSKYKVIGVMRRSSSPAVMKEKTPPPTMPKKYGSKIQFAEVSVKETPKPTATEVRNVHSLERKHSNGKTQRQGRNSVSPSHGGSGTLDGRSSASPHNGSIGAEDSLLASISNTLQATSRYGSDSLLGNSDTPSPVQPTANGPTRTTSLGQSTSSDSTPNLTGTPNTSVGEMKMSARGQLEKIRAAHSKEATPPLPHPSPLGLANPSIQNSLPQIGTNPYNKRGVAPGVGGIGRGARMATSLEALQRRQDTHVTYDTQTQAHIFRSLV